MKKGGIPPFFRFCSRFGFGTCFCFGLRFRFSFQFLFSFSLCTCRGTMNEVKEGSSVYKLLSSAAVNPVAFITSDVEKPMFLRLRAM